MRPRSPALSLVLALTACGPLPSRPSSPAVVVVHEVTKAPKVAPPRPETVRVKRGDLTSELALTGTLVPLVVIEVGSPVSGRVVQVSVDTNSVVKKGQLLAVIDSRHTRVSSPIDGLVLERRIDVGQTVALGVGSEPSPPLFTIASSLSNLQVVARVDEIDIGRVAAGMPVAFTVDAFPDKVFHATVQSVGQAPTPKGASVTYPAVIVVANLDGYLRPGMQANLSIATASRSGVLLVPLAALEGEAQATRATLTVLRAGIRVPVPVEIGSSDRGFAEIVRGEIAEGDEVVLPPPRLH